MAGREGEAEQKVQNGLALGTCGAWQCHTFAIGNKRSNIL
jgi:hypothetical protein